MFNWKKNKRKEFLITNRNEINFIHYLNELFSIHGTGIIEWKGKCVSCEKEVEVLAEKGEEGFRVNGGAVYEIAKEVFKVKCDKCYEEQSELTLYQDCEVYSRVVGYLRPTSQWNMGKVSEYNDRKMFDVGKK